MLHSLPDGTPVRIRPIEPGDRPRRAAMEQLSAETIRRRFLADKPSPSSPGLRHLTEVAARVAHRVRAGGERELVAEPPDCAAGRLAA